MPTFHHARENDGNDLRTSESSTAAGVDVDPGFSPRARRIAGWAGLCTVWIFALGYLQFALIDHWAIPASERVNDGRHATFFAVHINPYYVFSEDFHLYVVRSKRIFERGWTDSPLCHTANEGRNYAAPLQVALMGLAAQTDGRPLPYAIFMVAVLGISWSVLYLAAIRWSPPAVSPLTILAAVLLTVLLESVTYLLNWRSEFGQWPVHRGLRMATLGWTSPLGLAVLLAAVSLLFRRERPWGRLLFVGGMLVVLAAADSWAFLLSAANVCVVVAFVGAAVIVRRNRLPEGMSRWIVVGFVLTAGVAAGLAVNRVTSGAITGDAFTRAGFGPEWRASPLSVARTKEAFGALKLSLQMLTVIAVLAFTVIRGRAGRATREVTLRLAWPRPDAWKLWVVVIAAVPVVGWLLLVGAFSQLGMESYHCWQFGWRRDYMLLFALLALLGEGIRRLLRFGSGTAQTWQARQVLVGGVFLGVLFGYHVLRLQHFVRNVAAREFFLTRDEEELKAWLEQRDKTLGKYTLATASHELNYLCAFWTRADLLLPEGFPYHGVWTQSDIEERMARVLALYGATPERWEEFNLDGHVWDQWSWAESRLLSARHGYLYYLLHRGLIVNGVVTDPPLTEEPRQTTRYWAEVRLGAHQRKQHELGPRLIAGIETRTRIGEKLAAHPQLAFDELPDVIVIDEVSRFLGTPDLSGYTREFQHGGLEAWVKLRSPAPPE